MKNLYLFMVAVLVGIEICIGAFVAPVIFFPESFIGEGVLTHFQSGLMMTQIFLKYNYILLFVTLFLFVYEIFTFKNNRNLYLKISSFMFAFIGLLLACSFVFYFTDYILQAQKIGEVATIQNEEFAQVHKASEYVMKLMMIIQTALFFLKSYNNKVINS